jgi:hypothetical protein
MALKNYSKELHQSNLVYVGKLFRTISFELVAFVSQ